VSTGIVKARGARSPLKGHGTAFNADAMFTASHSVPSAGLPRRRTVALPEMTSRTVSAEIMHDSNGGLHWKWNT
jgi:hypothetical protein